MKHSLGKLLFYLLVIQGFHCIYAEEFHYDIHVDKQQVYLKEGLLLTVDINQTDPKNVLLFQFAVDKSNAYRIHPVSAHYDDTRHDTKLHNTYRVFPLSSGDVNITFKLIKRVTDDIKVAHYASGDRDDFKKLETTDIPVKLPAFTLHVKNVPLKTQLIGDFTLSTKVPTHKAKAFEPISMRIVIKGVGYPPALENLYASQEDVDFFIQKPEIKKNITSEGIQYEASYLMALSAQKDFTLPKVTLQAFNPHIQKPYTLTIPSQHFSIHSVNPNSLVDKKDYPPTLKTDWGWIKSWLSYLLVFSAGVLSAFAFKWQKYTQRKKQHPILDKVKESKDAKSLLQLLVAQNDKVFNKSIKALESLIYGTNTNTFTHIKKEILEILTCTQK